MKDEKGINLKEANVRRSKSNWWEFRQGIEDLRRNADRAAASVQFVCTLTGESAREAKTIMAAYESGNWKWGHGGAALCWLGERSEDDGLTWFADVVVFRRRHGGIVTGAYKGLCIVVGEWG